MIETIFDLIDKLGLAPAHLVAITLGLLVSWAGTQAAKKYWKFGGKKAFFTALALGFAPSYMAAPGWGMAEFWLAMAVGLCAPTAYKILISIAARRWQWARDLSGDTK